MRIISTTPQFSNEIRGPLDQDRTSYVGRHREAHFDSIVMDLSNGPEELADDRMQAAEELGFAALQAVAQTQIDGGHVPWHAPDLSDERNERLVTVSHNDGRVPLFAVSGNQSRTKHSPSEAQTEPIRSGS